jgi:hypothetical protein
VVEQPLKTAACGRHFVECCYELLLGLTGLASDDQQLKLEQMLVSVEDQVSEKGVKLFVDKFDDDITCHVSMMQHLDQLGESHEVLRVTQLCLKNLKICFQAFAEQACTYLPTSLIKEYIVKRKLSEYLRLLLMQVFRETFGDEDNVNDLSAMTCDFLAKLVEQFKQLHGFFDVMFTAGQLTALGVKEVEQIEEL